MVITSDFERRATDIKLDPTLLPVTPNPARNFNSLHQSASLINSSDLIRQPALAAGKYPHLLFAPKRLDPSARNDTESRYLSL